MTEWAINWSLAIAVLSWLAVLCLACGMIVGTAGLATALWRLGYAHLEVYLDLTRERSKRIIQNGPRPCCKRWGTYACEMQGCGIIGKCVDMMEGSAKNQARKG